MPTINADLQTRLEKIKEPTELLKTIFTEFGPRAAIGTSGQLTGTAVIDMAMKAGVKPRVFTNDTLRLFPETLKFFSDIEKRYGLKIERFTPDPTELKAMVETYGEFLFFDSKERQELCCQIRKVNPNQRALNTVDVWVTGLRGDQSQNRAATPPLSNH